MVFGKIEYLNLLPFHIFMKRFLRYSQPKASMHYHRGVPADINRKFLRRKVDAAFVSSIHAARCKKPKLGIVARKNVKSVLLIPQKTLSEDDESQTSNLLAQVMKLQGKILIGDKALRYALQSDDYIDLAAYWHDKTALPFVFATLCANRSDTLIDKIEKNFAKNRSHKKIPHYLLSKAARKTGIPPKDILAYLDLITYTLHEKERLSLKLFLSKAKQKKK